MASSPPIYQREDEPIQREHVEAEPEETSVKVSGVREQDLL